MSKEEFRINLDGRKYTIIRLEGGNTKFLRHGEPWPSADEDLAYTKVVNCLVDRVHELESRADFLEDVREFMIQFNQNYDGKPRALPEDLLNFRTGFMREEVTEYTVASGAATLSAYENEFPGIPGADVPQHLANALDAIVDEIYVQLGTAILHGFDLREAWRRVHTANMKKERVTSAEQSSRNSAYDVYKPPGWQKPDHSDLVADHAHKNRS